MAASILDSILNAVASQVSALNLTNGSSTVSVAVRKLPRDMEVLDGPLPILVVNKAEKPEPTKPLAFQGYGKQALLQKIYLIDVTTISAGNQDFTDANVDVYGVWREQIINAFRPDIWGNPILGVPKVYDIDVTPDVFLDRTMLSKSYDYQAVRLAWKTEE